MATDGVSLLEDLPESLMSILADDHAGVSRPRVVPLNQLWGFYPEEPGK